MEQKPDSGQTWLLIIATVFGAMIGLGLFRSCSSIIDYCYDQQVGEL